MTKGTNGVGWPSVGVVIVAGARDAFLRRAIRSVVSQRYPGRIECIVVFDRSPAFDLSDVAPPDGGDRTLRVTESRGGPGLAGARNEGADRAFGDVLSFCGAGDEWLQGKVAHQIAALEATGAEVAVTGVERVARGHALERMSASARLSPATLVRRRVTEIHPSTVAVRREAFSSTIGPFDETIPAPLAPYAWLLRAVVITDVVAVREALVRADGVGDPFIGGGWRTIATTMGDLTTEAPEPFIVHRRRMARPFGRVAGRRRSGSAERETAGARHGPRDAAGAAALDLTLGDVARRREPALGGLEIARSDRLGVGRGDAVEGRGSELHIPDIDPRNEVS
jgi:hypothetical protein